jgi:hypothetical protein
MSNNLENRNINSKNNYLNHDKVVLTDKEKAFQFDIDAKISILSLKDALLCTQQVSRVDLDRILLSNYFSRYNEVILNKQLLFSFEKESNNCNIEKSTNNHPDNNKYCIKIKKCDNKNNLYIFMLYKEAFDFYCKYISDFDKSNHFDKLNKELNIVENNLKQELRNDINKAKTLLNNIKCKI